LGWYLQRGRSGRHHCPSGVVVILVIKYSFVLGRARHQLLLNE
jgi:hypothetical protein